MRIRDRIKELRRVPAGTLRPNPRNWRLHPPAQQDALRGILAEVGYASALLARELADGTLLLIDGHLRAEATPDAIVPVLVLDVDEQEADKILLTHDPLAAMATVSAEHLQTLLAELDTDSAALRAMCDDLTPSAPGSAGSSSSQLEQIPEATIPESYQVVVECRDEADQRQVFDHMRGQGYRCRVLTL
ncbi:MAG: hypothetical protein U0805_20215 [Pirellulales bacterium]